jgi:hypothetical protein
MKSRTLIVGLVLAVSTLIVGGCAPPAAESAAAPADAAAEVAGTPRPTEAPIEVPDPARARDAALAYVAANYRDRAPAPDLAWTEESITPDGEVGDPTFQYAAPGWTVTVSFPLVAIQTSICTVVMEDQATGFHWEGEVDTAGQVTELVVGEQPPTEDDPYPGWASYVNTDYGFSFRYPITWTIEEVPAREDERGTWASSVKLTQGTLRLVVQYMRTTEDVLLEGGFGAGDVVDRGTVTFMGQQVPKQALVFEGQTKAVFCASEVGELVFRVQLDDDPGEGVDYGTIDLPEPVQAEVDVILGSFEPVLSE